MDDKKMFKTGLTCTVTTCVSIVKCDASTYDSKEDQLKEEVGVVVL